MYMRIYCLRKCDGDITTAKQLSACTAEKKRKEKKSEDLEM